MICELGLGANKDAHLKFSVAQTLFLFSLVSHVYQDFSFGPHTNFQIMTQNFLLVMMLSLA